MRVLSSPSYPGRRTGLADAVSRLREFTSAADHAFWPDTVSLLQPGLLDTTHVAGGRQLTDAYLLALAVRNDGTLASFDRAISVAAVSGATAAHLEIVGRASG